MSIKLLTALLFVVFAAIAPQPAVLDSGGTITVSTAKEFVNAIGSDRIINVKFGVYDFTQYNDEGGLTISDVDNLTIIGEIGAADTGREVEFVNADRFYDIINFQDCRNIKLQNIKAGHTPMEYECDAQVLEFRDCSDIVIENCYLYGCGSEGITARVCSGVTVRNTVITDCSLRAAFFSQTENISFENVVMSKNRGLDVAMLNDCRGVVFNNCVIADNINIKWSLIEVLGCEDVTLNNAVITGNSIDDIMTDANVCMFLCSDTLDINNAVITGNIFPYLDHGNARYTNCLVQGNTFEPELQPAE